MVSYHNYGVANISVGIARAIQYPCVSCGVPDFLRLWVLLAYTYLTKRRLSRNAPPLKKHSAKAAEYRALMAAPTSGTIQEDAAVRGGDKLILRGLKFHGFHGVKPEERKLGQKFVIDVDAWMDLREAGKSDHLSDTVSYTEIYRIVKEVVEGPPHNLLESVAQQIASTTLKNYPQISAVSVKVAKPHVAVHGPLDHLGVEIFRYRSIDAPK